MKTLLTMLLVPLLALAGDPTAHELDWLVGCWATPDGSSQEVWIAEADGSLVGFAVAIGSNKVRFYEILSIRRDEDGALIYTAHPAGQASTSFTAVERTPNSVLFVNANHDYPQEVGYRRESDRLYARISLLDGANPTSFDKMSCH